jgi:hypothetical protein
MLLGRIRDPTALARVSLALSLAFEHARILQDPSTYHWIIRRQSTPVQHPLWAFQKLSDLGRASAIAIGAETWCALILMLSVVLVCARTPRLRLLAVGTLLAMRLAWLAVHEG